MSGYLHSDFPLALLKLQYDVTLEVKPLTQEHRDVDQFTRWHGACLVLSQNKEGSFKLLIAPSMVATGISNESEATKAASLSVNAALPLRFDAGSASQSEKSSPPQTDWIRES